MNCKLNFFYGLFIFLLGANGYCNAQTNDSSLNNIIEAPSADTSIYTQDVDAKDTDLENIGDTVVTKIFFETGDDSIRTWKKDREFAYMAYLDSLLKQKKNELKSDTFHIQEEGRSQKKKMVASSGGNFLNSLPLQIFFWTLAIFFILFVLYKLFVKGGLFAKEPKNYSSISVADEPEKLYEYSEYDPLIHAAENSGDYNLAVRYLYLQTLKTLSDAEMIYFLPDKTNAVYISELSARECHDDFVAITHRYEYAWYGKISITPERYAQIKNQFISFNKAL